MRDWEARTTNQLVVLMVPTTSPEPIENYSLRVAEAWKIGQKGKDNGAIFLIAKDDKRMRIEVGYGFEGVLTDVTSRRIIGETVAPLFQAGPVRGGHQRRRRPDHCRRRRRRAAAAAGFGQAQRATPLVRLSEPCSSCCWWRFRSSERYCARFSATLGGSAIGAGSGRNRGVVHRRVFADRRRRGGDCVRRHHLSMFGGGRGGGWIPGGMGGGGGFGGGGGGGGFSGGGGSFGGGGASGGWD